MGIVTNDSDAGTTRRDDDRAVQTVDTLASSQSPSLRAISAVADATERDPTAMAPLYDSIDPEALDQLLDTDAALQVVFEYQGCTIEIGSDGSIAVDDVERPSGDRQ